MSDPHMTIWIGADPTLADAVDFSWYGQAMGPRLAAMMAADDKAVAEAILGIGPSPGRDAAKDYLAQDIGTDKRLSWKVRGPARGTSEINCSAFGDAILSIALCDPAARAPRESIATAHVEFEGGETPSASVHTDLPLSRETLRAICAFALATRGGGFAGNHTARIRRSESATARAALLLRAPGPALAEDILREAGAGQIADAIVALSRRPAAQLR